MAKARARAASWREREELRSGADAQEDRRALPRLNRHAEQALIELERARRYLAGNHCIDLQRNASHAAHVALDALYGIAPDAYQSLPERIAAVTPADVLRVAKRVIRLDARSEAVVRP